MVRMTYVRYHIPQICNNEHHNAGVFTEEQDSQIFLTAELAIQALMDYNRVSRCYRYALTFIEDHYDKVTGTTLPSGRVLCTSESAATVATGLR